MLNGKRIGRIALSLVVICLLVISPVYGNSAADSDTSDVPLYEEPGVERVLASIGPKAEARIKPFFDRAGISYPSRQLTFVVLKEERKFEVWTEDGGNWVHVRTYDILAASGSQGPKQRSGDCQVPEGIYQIIGLNPASRFHLSMKINYPNDYDLQRARDEKRLNLGGDIYIHGKAKSRGCIAIGDTAIEELFVLVAKTRPNNVKVVIAPHDLRKYGPITDMPSQPSWLPDLYKTIGQELTKFQGREDSQLVTISGKI